MSENHREIEIRAKIVDDGCQLYLAPVEDATDDEKNAIAEFEEHQKTEIRSAEKRGQQENASGGYGRQYTRQAVSAFGCDILRATLRLQEDGDLPF